MRIFLYEWICSGGLAHEKMIPSLYNEGRTMFIALARDLAEMPDVQVVTSLDERVVSSCMLPKDIIWTSALSDRDGFYFRRIAKDCDLALVVAPEVGDALWLSAAWLAEAGCPSLGPDKVTLKKASDKGFMSALWENAGVPCIPTTQLNRSINIKLPAFECVVKLARGAGSWGNRVIRSIDEAQAMLDWAEKGDLGSVLIQPYMKGIPTSIAALVGPDSKDPKMLIPCLQILSDDGKLSYKGGRTPLSKNQSVRVTQLGRKALACMDGLLGWIGIDILLGAADDGSADLVVELNPRCTTSYAGLRHIFHGNLAEAWITTVQGSTLEMAWLSRGVQWDNQGNIKLQHG